MSPSGMLGTDSVLVLVGSLGLPGLSILALMYPGQLLAVQEPW